MASYSFYSGNAYLWEVGGDAGYAQSMTAQVGAGRRNLQGRDKELKTSRAETLEVKLQQETTPTEGLSCRKVEAVNRGHTSLKEQVHPLKSEQMKLEEDVRHKDEWIQTETKKRRASTESYLA
ncbi:unnamed protein product [Pleuronectes platessa]|uniref:Uncharacterized protein n=1 Tax=Pleuronectes platessa TaxID=8262 RepID=A0A9N7TK75_PLEPL|nr:unnamed protein product [Pleuronectes platessa]